MPGCATPRNVAVHLQGLDNLDLVGAQREFGARDILPNNFWILYVKVIFLYMIDVFQICLLGGCMVDFE